MFKNKNKIARISNAIIMTIGAMALISVVSLLTGDYTSVEGYTKELYLYNLVIMISCAVVAIVLLLVLNTKINLYKDEYTLSRKLFNLFIVFSILSLGMMVAMPIAEYFIYGDFYLYNILYIILGYIPAYVCGYIVVNKKEMLNSNNSKKINVTNFFVIYLLMSYYINIVTDIIQLLYKLEETKTLLIDMGISIAWIAVVLVAYKMIHRDETSTFISNKKDNTIKEAKVIEEKPMVEPKKIVKKTSTKSTSTKVKSKSPTKKVATKSKSPTKKVATKSKGATKTKTTNNKNNTKHSK